MGDQNHALIWEDMVRSYICEGQKLYAQGHIEAAEEHFRKALEALVQGYQRSIIAFCRNMLGGHSEKADDVAQEVFLAAWRTLPTFRHQASVRTWLFAIARNQCWNVFNQSTRDAKAQDIQRNEGREVSFDAPLIDEQYARKDIAARVVQGLSQLRSEDREILVLTYITEMPRAEIAQLLGIAQTTIGTRRKRALERLREVIGYEKGSA